MKEGSRTDRRGTAARWGAVLTVLLLLVGGMGAIVRVEQGRAEDRAAASGGREAIWVETRPAELQPGYTVDRSYLGEAEAARASQLGFELAGTVARVHAQLGDRVAAGQRLAELDQSRLVSRKSELEALLLEAESRQRLAEANFRRISGLVQSRVATEQELDEIRQERESAAATVTRVKAQLRSVAIDLEKSELRAPYAGMISRRYLDEGSIVSPGTPVLGLIESDRMELRVGVPAEMADDLTAGGALEVRIPSGETIEAAVLRLSPRRDARTRTVDVLLAAPEGTFREGDVIEVMVEQTVTQPGYWVPVGALTESDRGLWACYVAEEADGGHVTERRQLEILHLAEDRAFVQGALAPGDRVIVNGIHRLTPGLRVEPREQSPGHATAQASSR